MVELPAQLVLCGLDSRQQLLDTSIITHGQQRRSTVSLLVGRAGAQVSMTTMCLLGIRCWLTCDFVMN